MAYSGAAQARQVREILGKALATLQLDPTVPPQGADVAAYMAQAVGSLFVAENAPDDAIGRQAVRSALGLLGQSLAQMQQVQPPVAAIENAMGGLAQAMGFLFPLTIGAESFAPPSAAFLGAPPAAAAPVPSVTHEASHATPSHPNALPTRGEPVRPADPVVPVVPVAKVTTQPAPTSSLLSSSGRTSKSTLLFAEIPAPIVSITSTPIEDSPAPGKSIPEPAVQARKPAQTIVGQPMEATQAPVRTPQQPIAQQPQPVAQQPAPQPVAQQPAPQPVAHAPAPAPSAFQPASQTAAAAAAPVSAAFQPSVPPSGSPLFGGALAPAPPPEQPSFARPASSSAGVVAAVSHAATAPAPSPGAFGRASADAAARYVPSAAVDTSGRSQIEANIGLRTEANFWVGFDDEIARGGVFVPTYEDLEPGTPVVVLVTLPEGASFRSAARVRFIRDPSEADLTLEPGIGLAFESLAPDSREVAKRFLSRRPPLFYDLG